VREFDKPFEIDPNDLVNDTPPFIGLPGFVDGAFARRRRPPPAASSAPDRRPVNAEQQQDRHY